MIFADLRLIVRHQPGGDQSKRRAAVRVVVDVRYRNERCGGRIEPPHDPLRGCFIRRSRKSAARGSERERNGKPGNRGTGTARHHIRITKLQDGVDYNAVCERIGLKTCFKISIA